MKKTNAKKDLIYILVLLLAIAAVIGAKVGGIRFLTVLTGSMEPDIPTGSVIMVVPVEPDTLEIGDDITYVLNENLVTVTHRIIELDLENDQVVTQGLANNIPDGSIRVENIVGKVFFHIPYLGYLLILLNRPSGWIGLAVIILIFWILSGLFGRRKNGQNDIEE